MGYIHFHKMTLFEEPFRAIQRGQKVYEIRLYDDKRSRIDIGDFIYFYLKNKDSIEDVQEVIGVKVTSIHRYPDFNALYKDLPVKS